MKLATLAFFVSAFLAGDLAFARSNCVRQIADGNAGICILDCDGTVRCLHGSDPDKAVPVPGIARAVQIGVGSQQMCALAKDGKVFCWSYDGSENFVPDDQLLNSCEAYLGNDYGDILPIKMSMDSTPVRIPELDGTVQLAVNYESLCALSKNGTIRCWGEVFGRRTDYFMPQQVPGIGNAVQIAVDTGGAVCAVLADRQVRCWRFNEYAGMDPPVAVDGLAKAVSISASHSFFHVIRPDGTVARWKSQKLFWNFSDEELESTFCGDVDDEPILTTIPGIDDATRLLAGGMNARECVLRRSDKVVCWAWSWAAFCPTMRQEVGFWGPRKLGDDLAESVPYFTNSERYIYSIRDDGAGFFSEWGWERRKFGDWKPL